MQKVFIYDKKPFNNNTTTYYFYLKRKFAYLVFNFFPSRRMPDDGGNSEGILRLPQVSVENSPERGVRFDVGEAGTQPPRFHEDRQLPRKGGDGGSERFFFLNVYNFL